MWAGNVPNQGESFSQQWNMSASAPYANMPHEQVDWATLAQQWIKMKEETPSSDKEGGEAPMEIAKDEPGPSNWLEPPPHSDGTAAMGWGWKMNKNAEWVWTAPKAPASPAVPPYNPAIPAFQTGITAPEPPMISTDPNFPYAVPAERPSYWSGATSKKSHWEHKKKHDSVESLPELDAAKRKILPAWIREGLEKMEKEKLKKAECDKQEKIRTDDKSKTHSAQRNQIPNGDFELPKKSKFDSDSDDSEPIYKKKEEPQKEKKRSRFDWSESQPPKSLIHRTKEQILEACMLDVRKVLTRLLMEVTTEEIQKAVDDSNKKYRRKAPATPIRKTSALTSLTGKLGLGIYDSGSSSESEAEKVTDRDSDQEIRDRIVRLKDEFSRVEEKIEKEAQEQEDREKRQLKGETVSNDGSQSEVEDQVQQSSEGTSSRHEKQHTDSKYKESQVSRKDKSHDTDKSNGKNKKNYRDSSSSSSSSTDSESSYDSKKRKDKYNKDRRHSRSRSRLSDRRRKEKSHYKRSRRSPDRRRQRSSSSSSSGRHSRKSSHRRDR